MKEGDIVFLENIKGIKGTKVDAFNVLIDISKELRSNTVFPFVSKEKIPSKRSGVYLFADHVRAISTIRLNSRFESVLFTAYSSKNGTIGLDLDSCYFVYLSPLNIQVRSKQKSDKTIIQQWSLFQGFFNDGQSYPIAIHPGALK